MEKLHTLYTVDSKDKVRVYSIEIDGARFRTITGLQDGKKVTSGWTECYSKNTGKSNATTAEEQAKIEALSKYRKKEESNYYKTVEEAQTSTGQYFEVMLASVGNKNEFDAMCKKAGTDILILDPKLDGMRMSANFKENKTRNGKPIPSVDFIKKEIDEYLKDHTNITLDGELYNHDYHDSFNELMSIFKRTNLSDEDRDLVEKVGQYHLYDIHVADQPNLTAIERKKLLDKVCKEIDLPMVKAVEWKIVCSQEELDEAVEENLKLGYEGSMIRFPNSIYKHGRSKELLKIKEFITEEFTIIDILEGEGNNSGMAGSIEVNAGIVVSCGIRGDWNFRKKLLADKNLYIGKLATIRHFGRTPDKSLRFPVCIEIDRWSYE
jgi:DNA ligase-1